MLVCLGITWRLVETEVARPTLRSSCFRFDAVGPGPSPEDLCLGAELSVSIRKCSRSEYKQAHLEKAGTLTGCLCGTMSYLNMLAKGRKTSAQAD